MATENESTLSSLSPKEQKKADRLQKKPFAERMGVAGKTPWDWVQLLLQVLSALALPVALFIATQWFTTQQNKASDIAAATRYANDKQLAEDQQQETTLKTYLDDMTTLIFVHKLGSQADQSASQAAIIAQAKTLTVLRRLSDPGRKAIVVQFLYESHLIGYYDKSLHKPIIKLVGADLHEADLVGANLFGAYLVGVNLSFANLSYAKLGCANLGGGQPLCANLSDANLSYANLSGAYLVGAILNAANLSFAILSYTKLGCANLSDGQNSCTFLSSADLHGATLNGANLHGAYLNRANLDMARLNDANLEGAHLEGAHLRDAKGLTQQQLDQVYSCQTASLSSGLTCHKPH